MVEFLSFPLLSHLSSLSKLEESMGCVEEAGLQQQDKGNPLVVRLVFHLKSETLVHVPFLLRTSSFLASNCPTPECIERSAISGNCLKL